MGISSYKRTYCGVSWRGMCMWLYFDNIFSKERIHLLHSTNDSFNHSLHLSSKDTIQPSLLICQTVCVTKSLNTVLLLARVGRRKLNYSIQKKEETTKTNFIKIMLWKEGLTQFTFNNKVEDKRPYGYITQYVYLS